MPGARKPIPVESAAVSLYDRDFFEWTQSVAEALRNGKVSEHDLEHISEEIADMGKRDRREVQSRMIVLIMHLIKWTIQPERREGSTWMSTINEQRQELELVLADSPSLRRFVEQELALIYWRACQRALRETGLKTRLPHDCPYTLDQILRSDWFPADQ